MAKKPNEYASLSGIMVVENAQSTIDTYVKALGAEVVKLLRCPNSGKVVHSNLKFGDSTMFICDPKPEMNCGVTGQQRFYFYVDNLDSAYERALKDGFTTESEPQDTFWGDRMAVVLDKHGNQWGLAQYVRDVTDEEIQAAMTKMAEAVT